MAKAYECDVCGNLFKREPNVKIVDYHGNAKELCPECQKELENWIKGKKGKRK